MESRRYRLSLEGRFSSKVDLRGWLLSPLRILRLRGRIPDEEVRISSLRSIAMPSWRQMRRRRLSVSWIRCWLTWTGRKLCWSGLPAGG